MCRQNCGKSRTSKRKRRRGRERTKAKRDRIGLANPNETTGDISDPRSIQMARHQGNKKKRKRENKSVRKEVEAGVNSKEWMYYQMMARIVIAPYTPFLIGTMNFMQSSLQSDTSANALSIYETSLNEHPAKKAQMTLGSSVTNETITNNTTTTTPGTSVKNIYLKSGMTKKTSKYISLSPPRESLESLVDDVVGNLVQRTHSLRKSYPGKEKPFECNIIYRRRQRKNRSKQPSQAPKRVVPARFSTNDWLRSSNILSKGYTIGSSDILSPYYSKTNKVQNPTILRACPNMAPGIHCIQPNSLTTYARSSGLMRLLHTVIGDEILSEILLNTIILIPAVDETNVEDPSQSLFGRGNYFQLCGPPLNMVAKQFKKINGTTMGTIRSPDTFNSRKRKREDEEVHSKLPCADKAPHNLKTERNPNKPISLSKLLYSDFYARNVGLSPHHVLNQPSSSKASDSRTLPTESEIKLLDEMVQLWPRGGHGPNGDKNIIVYSNKRRNRWKRLRETGILMCREIIRRHKLCDYARLLGIHCTLLIDKCSQYHDSKKELSHLVTRFTSTENVGHFLKSVLRTTFPNSFWGSKRNFSQMIQNINAFINLRLTESFPEKLIIEGIRVVDMKWLHPPQQKPRTSEPSRKMPKLTRSGHESAVVLLINVMRWVYCQYIIPLLRSTFYITDTEFTGRKVVYYRKPVWARIKSLSFKSLLKRQYRKRTVEKAKKVLLTHNIGCPPAPMRLLPKKTGIRAVAMLSKACRIDDTALNERTANRSQPNSVAPNKLLRSTFQALKYEYKKRPMFGAGALGVTEVFPSYCSFLDALRRKFSGDTPQLYFTSADIEHCYDNINQERLYKQVRSVLTEDQYITQNHLILHPKERSTRCRWQRITCSSSNISDISASKVYSKKFYNSIFIDGMSLSVDKKQTIIGLLKDHIFGQMVVANGSTGQRLFLQRNGIPQGSILSSLFCNAYFGGHVEDKMFDGVFNKDSMVIMGSNAPKHKVLMIESSSSLNLLVRIVDDFLLISTDYDTSVRFLRGLSRGEALFNASFHLTLSIAHIFVYRWLGIPQLGVKANHDKTRINYKVSPTTDNIHTTLSSEKMFPWCGLLVDTKTCEIRIDGSRFAGSLAADNVIVHRQSGWSALSKKMKYFVEPRCRQQLLFSSFVNSPDTIRINFYHTIMLCALKTLHYMERSGGSSHAKHFKFVYRIAFDTIQYSHSLISQLRGELGMDENSCPLPYCLTLAEAIWLGRHAFYTVIRESRFKDLREFFSEHRNMPVDNRNVLINASKMALDTWPL